MHERHRTFALTPPDHSRGRRVKPRLLYVTWGYTVTMLSAAVATWLLLIQLFCVFQDWGVCEDILIGASWGTVLLVGLGTVIALKRLFVRFGLLTREEANSFPPVRGWPESWLEPISTSNRSAGAGPASGGLEVPDDVQAREKPAAN